MTLRSRIQDLHTFAAVANDQNQVRLRAGQLADLSDRLSGPAQDLPALKVALVEVRQLNVEIPADLEQEAAQVADGLRKLCMEMRVMTVDANLDLAKVRVRNAEKFATQLRVFLRDTWQRHVAQPLPPINRDLVDALAQGGVDVEAIRASLESAQGQLVAIVNRTIPLRGDVDKFSAAVESLRACGDQVGSVVDPDIAEGIVGAQEESGMPLAWFTAERLQVLTEQGIIDRFRVRLR